jgi:hypothetical protein
VAKELDPADMDPKLIAQTQFLRWRRRLGQLTPEQELSVEHLLTSTATKISRLARRALVQTIETRESNITN